MDENKRFSKYAHKKSKTMGLLNCFGLRTKSYNAKKYELNAEKKDKNKKRVSTDSFGVADTNVHPQLIEETGGGIHPIISDDMMNDKKDSNENIPQLNDNQKNQINQNEKNEKTDEQTITKEERQSDEKCPESEDKQKQELTQESEHQKESIVVNHIVVDSDHQINSTPNHDTSVECDNQSHTTDQNTVSMDTSDSSGGAVDSSANE